jgi:HSP20 family protein
MYLTLWEPALDIAEFHNRASRFLEEAFRWSAGFSDHRVPPVTVAETDDAWVLQAEVPGLSKDDISLEVQEGILTIRGERREETEDKRDGYLKVERFCGSFVRSFALPKPVDTDGIRARLKNGVLEVTLPKLAEARRHSIAIETS